MKNALIMQPNDVKKLVSLHAKLSEIVGYLTANGAVRKRRRKPRAAKAKAAAKKPKAETFETARAPKPKGKLANVPDE